MRRRLPIIAAFSLGLFTIGAQAALLREYLVLFRGSELALGFFFAAWFLWVACGATLFRRIAVLRKRVVTAAMPLVALYPICALAGMSLLAAVRLLAGVPPWEPTPPPVLMAGALFSALPVSLLTGLVFPALCESTSPEQAAGATRGYVAETAGAVAGGGISTAGFYLGLDGLQVAAILGLFPVTAGFLGCRGRAVTVPAIAALAVAAVLVPGLGAGDRLAALRLKSNLAGAELASEVRSPYRLVTTASLPGQTVVLMDGSVEAAFPGGPDLEGTAALLASQPVSRGRAAVVGLGRFGLAVAFARYFDRVDCVSEDVTAMAALREAYLSRGGSRAVLDRLALRGEDPRAFARDGAGGQIDLVVIGGAEPGTLLANRLYTVDFLEAVRERLSPGGVVAASVLSAENYLGTEVLRYGQSIVRTFSAVFPEVAVVPGDQALVMAGRDKGRLAIEPGELTRRYRSFAPSPPPFEPGGLANLVLPERVDFIRSVYGSGAPGDLLNSDDRPVAAFLYLLAMLKESDSPGPQLLWAVREAGPLVPVLILILTLLVLVRQRLRLGAGSRGYSSGFMMAVAGGVSISSSVALLSSFQAAVGAVYGEVGAAVALSMAGMALGAWMAGRYARGAWFAVAYCAVAAVAMAAMGYAVAAASTLDPVAARAVFAPLLLAAGAVTGAAWPIAGAIAGGSHVAASLEAWDHWGATVASAVVGVLVLAVWGVSATFLVMSALLAIAMVVAALDAFLASMPGSRYLATRSGRAFSSRSLPWVLAPGMLWFLAGAALVLFHAGRPEDKGMRTRLGPEEVSRIEPHEGETFSADPFAHHRLTGVKDPPGDAVLVTTASVALDIAGHGGPMNLVMSVGTDGAIRRVVLLAHNETPGYVREFPGFLGQFKGRSLRRPFAFDGPDAVHAITGATVTSEAAIQSLNRARQEVGARILGIPMAESPPPRPWHSRLLDPAFIYAAIALAGAFAVHRWGNRRARLGFLAASLLAGGLSLNVQLSVSWLQNLFRGSLPSAGGDPAMFVMTVGFIVLSLGFGPLYCAHACPFGAAQELLGRLGARLGLSSCQPASWSGWVRGVKYAVLALVACSILARDPAAIIGWDPLAAAFSGEMAGPAWVVVALAALGAVFFFRLYCRVFCPVGAFFLLFNRAALLIGISPPRRYQACDLDVGGPHDCECLQCNRCTRESHE